MFFLSLLRRRFALPGVLLIVMAWCHNEVMAADVFLRFKVTAVQSPNRSEQRLRVTVSGFRHADPWYLPTVSSEVVPGAWSGWLDLRQWPLHSREKRVGGIAEWPSLKLSVARAVSSEAVNGCALDVQLADSPNEQGVVISFSEKSESNSIGFLLPHPLRENAKEFETGSQMTARHGRWATEAVRGKPIALKKFDIITSIWGHYDPALARQAVQTLRLLGFNVVRGVDHSIIRNAGLRTYDASWVYDPDPDAATRQWQELFAPIAKELATPQGQWLKGAMAHRVISDEVKTLDFRNVEAAKLNVWFRDYLRQQGVTDAEMGRPVDQLQYPAPAMHEKSLPREADLPTRRLMYHAAKFGHWWSARQLRHTTNLIQSSLPGLKTETLPSDHGFFNAWGPPHIGMSYPLLDLFELGAQRSVDQLSAEDWLGLNHMYGPAYTWTGGQTYGYFNAILRSATQLAPDAQPIMLRGLITPSDDAYLRLKAYSSLGQGAKSFFFWTFGPTYIGTENYWSDLRSEYDGIAKLNRALEKSEEVLYPAQPVRDPVAILYSVSHDIWHTDDPAAFVEKRLLWHALRHLQVQPDFLREEEISAGRLKPYKVLYIADWCLSRKASLAIDEWVRAGGVLHLSAGAATRDEFFEPYVPPFAQMLWPDEAARQLQKEAHSYNERTDLLTIKPMTRATITLNSSRFDLPVLGCRLNLRPGAGRLLATFEDGTAAGAIVSHGRGQVLAWGFLPMLAYSQGAGFKPSTLEEEWPARPREIIKSALNLAAVKPIAQANVPVVETSLLSGANGLALVLANYTYQPIEDLQVDLRLTQGQVQRIARVVSSEGKPVRWRKTTTGVRLVLPLEWTDLVLLTPK